MFCRHCANFKIWFSDVQDLGNFYFHPVSDGTLFKIIHGFNHFKTFVKGPLKIDQTKTLMTTGS